MENKRIYLRDDKTSYFDTYLQNKFLNEITEVKRPALIICPGGCYLYKSNREGEPVAMQFAALGYQCFILQYPTLWKKKYYRKEDIELNPLHPYPEQVYDLLKTIKIVRDNADEWGVDKDKVYVLGFSAGGHVAASAAVNWNNPKFLGKIDVADALQVKPNGAVLCYPMLDAELIHERAQNIEQIVFEREEDAVQADYLMQTVFGTDQPTDKMWEEMNLINQIGKDTAPIFLWHTFEDQVTLALQSTRFIEKLIENRIPCEYHMFAKGHHGMSLCTPVVATIPGDYLYNNAIWPVLADLFLKGLE